MKRKKLGIILVLFGLTIAFSAVYMKYEGYIRQKKMINEFEKSINKEDEKETNIYEDNEVESKSDKGSTPESKASHQSIDRNGTVGILSIPKIDLKVAVGEGVDMKTLKYAAGHFPDTPYPGELGNSAIAGHRSYTYNQFFNRLDEVEKDDEIKVQTKNGEFTYVVYKKFVVLPEEVSVLNDTEDSTLTLVTCTPIRSATHRLIIKAKLMD